MNVALTRAKRKLIVIAIVLRWVAVNFSKRC